MKENSTILTKNQQDQHFSYFEKPITNVTPKREPLTISCIYKCIIGGKFKDATGQIRAVKDKCERNRLKSKLLPYVTFSGIFRQRSDSELIQHSGLICIDIDHVKIVVTAIMDQVKSSHMPVLMFRSPSGDGLKVVYLVDMAQGVHLEYFHALQNYFKWELDIDIDVAGKDISRACFLCHDAEAFTSTTPYKLDKDFIDTYTLGNNIIEMGKEFLQRNEVKFLEGTRNNYVMQLAGYCHRANLPVEEAHAELIKLEEPGFPAIEIEGIIRSIYKNVLYSGVAIVTTIQQQKRTNEIPPFPVEAFPTYLRDLVNECYSVYGTPLDFWGGAILAAFSTAIGNSVLLHDGKYRNNTALWFAFVAPTGIGKTEPLSFAFRPFHKLDQIAFTEYETRKALYDSYHNTSAKNRGEMEEPERPALMQYLLSDFTPESLAQVHHDNRRGIIVHRDELMAWINDFGRYNKSGEVQNWLSIWSGEAATYNRKSQNPIKITHPCVSIAGGIQPDLIRSMGADHRAENGLMQRFCFLYPDQTVKPYYNQKRLSTGIEENYDRFIKTLLSIPMDAETILSLTEGAQDLYRDFVNRNTDAINQEKSDHVKGIFSKLEIIVLRLSMILHLASAAISGDIDADINEETMESAIKITEYFRETGIKVYDHFSSGDGLTKAAVAKYLYHKAGLKNQSEIARVLGVSQPYISKVIRL